MSYSGKSLAGISHRASGLGGGFGDFQKRLNRMRRRSEFMGMESGCVTFGFMIPSIGDPNRRGQCSPSLREGGMFTQCKAYLAWMDILCIFFL
jgi:hypothetical protein